MNILILGDIVGPSGREALIKKLPNLIKKPTRVTDHSKTIIDHVYTQSKNLSKYNTPFFLSIPSFLCS